MTLLEKLQEKEESLIDRFNECEDEAECERLLSEISELQQLMIYGIPPKEANHERTA